MNRQAQLLKLRKQEFLAQIRNAGRKCPDCHAISSQNTAINIGPDLYRCPKCGIALKPEVDIAGMNFWARA